MTRLVKVCRDESGWPRDMEMHACEEILLSFRYDKRSPARLDSNQY